MMCRMFLLACVAFTLTTVKCVPEPKSVPFVQPFTLHTYSNYGLPGTPQISSLLDIASRNYRTAQLLQELQAQVQAAAYQGFAAGKQAGVSHAFKSIAGQGWGGYPGAYQYAGYNGAYGGYPGSTFAGYPTGYSGYPGGTTIEQVHVGGVPVSQTVQSVGVQGFGGAKVPVTSTVHTSVNHQGLPISKSVQQIGGAFIGGYPSVFGR